MLRFLPVKCFRSVVGYKTAGAVRLPSRGFDDLSYESTVSKLNADGTLDTSFGTRGIVDFGGEFPFVVTANTIRKDLDKLLAFREKKLKEIFG